MNLSDEKDNIIKLKKAINEADAVIIGAGSGLSTAAGVYLFRRTF